MSAENSDNDKTGEENSFASNVSELEANREQKRSNVRIYITYASIGMYLILASIVIVWLMWAGRHEVAIGVLGGVAGLAGSITGFWFGARKPTDTKQEQTGKQSSV